MAFQPILLDVSPARDLFAITPSDTVSFVQGTARGFMVGAAGTVTLVTPQGTVVLLTAPAVGVIHWIACTRINATGTIATTLVGVL